MIKRTSLLWICFCLLCGAEGVTLEGLLSAPFPTDLTAAPKGGRLAWVLNERGARNIWVAGPGDYKGRRLTAYTDDDGQEIAGLVWTPDGESLVYVRGGDFEFPGRTDPNPESLTAGVEQAIWMVPAAGGAPRKLAEGMEPAMAPDGGSIAFLKKDGIYSVKLSAGAKPEMMLHARGSESSLAYSPAGRRLAFVSARSGPRVIAVYEIGSKRLVYLDPSVDRDMAPAWSPDSQRVAFLRIAAVRREFAFGPVREGEPWSIRLAEAGTGTGREIWRAQAGPGSVFHAMLAVNQLLWAAGDRIVFPWEKTGWVHLYSIGAAGGEAAPIGDMGEYEIEHVSLSRDGRDVLYSSNEDDIDRRHLWRAAAGGGAARKVTRGEGIEWAPVELDGGAVAYLCSTATMPAHAAIAEKGGAGKALAPDSLPAAFPAAALVTPQQVIFNSADGMKIHGQLFLPAGGPGKHAAMIFFHGGSRRQMVLGWHYMDYYHNSYAMNQYLASLGFVVLSVNYRSGIGYGLNFREAENYGATGASEFNDVQGAALYLAARHDVDRARIGLWGGSYGGYLTALGLARASDLFAAGVDFHGVHDWNLEIPNFVPAYDPRKDPQAARIAFDSSPLASVSTWHSPVLLIHGDDDRNVPFAQTVALVEALRKQHVEFEQMILPDEIHGFLRYGSWLRAYQRSAEFLGAHLRPQQRQ